jgi:hypothetical protein
MGRLTFANAYACLDPACIPWDIHCPEDETLWPLCRLDRVTAALPTTPDW